MWRRILAVLVARNREFYRDRAGLGWNIFMPILMVLAFAVIFSGDPEAPFKVGVVTVDGTLPPATTGFLALDHIQFVPVTDLEGAITQVDRHQLDLLLDPRAQPPAYWVNLESPAGTTWRSASCSGLMPGWADLPRVKRWDRSGGPAAVPPCATRTGCCRAFWP
jgi:ABC-2 type transport system permease protein